MVIKVSTLLAHNTVVQDDLNPTLGGSLNTNNFPIINGGNPVTITGNQYPITTGSSGQVLTTDGAGNLSWQTPAPTGVTSVGLDSPGASIVISGSASPITSSGTFHIDLSNTGVVAGSYGSVSNVATFNVNSQGRLTSASSVPISILPSQAGLGNVTNALQVINAGGSPSILTGIGLPSGSSNPGALYVDQAVTNGNGIYTYYSGTWVPVAKSLKLYNENVPGIYTAPVALGTNSIALGEGSQTSASAQDSLAIGNQSLARTQGSVVQANGRFSNSGDAQVGRYILRGTTTNAFPGELFIDGASVRLVLPDNSTWTYRITITAHRTDATTGHAGFEAKGVIYRVSGAASTALQGIVNYTVLSSTNPTWNINISADSVNGSLKITVTGSAGNIIRWVALVETVEVTN